jgi:undecaprenyl-diphosphatase
VTLALWLLDRPGTPPRWRLACLGGVTAAGLGLLAAQPITWLWARERPFVAHPHETVLAVAPSHEPSFPSDHAVAAFAIAFAVAFFGRRMGVAFLAAASVIAVTRVIVGLHYPGDVLGGAAIGFGAAYVVVRLGRGPLEQVVRLVSRLTDPLLAPAWNALDRARPRRRAHA